MPSIEEVRFVTFGDQATEIAARVLARTRAWLISGRASGGRAVPR